MFIFLDGGNFANANKANKTTNECAKKEYKERQVCLSVSFSSLSKFGFVGMPPKEILKYVPRSRRNYTLMKWSDSYDNIYIYIMFDTGLYDGTLVRCERQA